MVCKDIPLNPALFAIIDIKSYNLKTNKIENTGWTVFPLFEDLEVDDDLDTTEFFLDSGRYNLPLFKGTVDPEIVNDLKEQRSIWKYLMECLGDEENSLERLESKSVIIKCLDN